MQGDSLLKAERGFGCTIFVALAISAGIIDIVYRCERIKDIKEEESLQDDDSFT